MINCNQNLTFLDLFCGIGGFHIALNRINKIYNLSSECVLACDNDKYCNEVYNNNFNILPHNDIKTIDPYSLDNVDIICGGFPCQSFSNAGKKQMLNDERGLLFDEIIRIAKITSPKFMFLENVKHIRKVGNGEVYKYIISCLENIGYHIQTFDISPHEYGIPQQRNRVYFVCVRNDIYNNNPKDIVLPPKNSVFPDIDFSKFLEDYDNIDDKYKIDGDILNVLKAWDEMIHYFENDEKLSPTIMINEEYNNHTQEDFKNYPAWRQEYIIKNKPLIKKYKKHFDKWYIKHQNILNKRAIFSQLEWQVGPKKSQNESIFDYFIQIRQSGIRVKKAHYFPTLVAINQTPIYGKEKRYITPRECARLQSFPDSFKIHSNDKQAYKQLGNAVNVDNVFTVIESTFKHYNII